MRGAALLSTITRWTAILGLGWAAVTIFIWDIPTALGVVAGAAIGCGNFWLIARALGKMMNSPEEHRGSKWTAPAALLLKWPLLFGVLALVLLYLPVTPQGVAMGAVLSLVAAMFAALRAQGRVSAEADESNPPDGS